MILCTQMKAIVKLTKSWKIVFPRNLASSISMWKLQMNLKGKQAMTIQMPLKKLAKMNFRTILKSFLTKITSRSVKSTRRISTKGCHKCLKPIERSLWQWKTTLPMYRSTSRNYKAAKDKQKVARLTPSLRNLLMLWKILTRSFTRELTKHLEASRERNFKERCKSQVALWTMTKTHMAIEQYIWIKLIWTSFFF